MKYQSKSITDGLAIMRLEQVTKAESSLIDALVVLGAGMHDDRLKELVEAAYNRAKYIHGALAAETAHLELKTR